METLTIDRGMWLTGRAREIFGVSYLRHAKSHLQCCLGFLAKSGGLCDDQITSWSTMTSLIDNPDIPSPRSETLAQFNWVSQKLDAKDKARFGTDDVQWALIAINDRETRTIHPTRRESAIKYLFKKYGSVDVNFVGSYADGTARARAAYGA
jgi:hypothetical protein